MPKSLHFESLEQRCLLAANLIADLNTVAGGFYRPRDAVQVGDLTYVRAEDVEFGYAGLWVTDGTERDLEVIHFGVARDLTNLNGQFLFADDELYTSDGTPGGTDVVKDIWPGEEASGPRYLTAAGDKLFFTADDGSLTDQLWVSDGTEDGTLELYDFGSRIIFFDAQPLDDQIIFWNPVAGSGYELWVSDGSAAGTVSLASFEDNSEFAVVGDHAYFLQPDGLYRTDGTAAGTQFVTNVFLDAPSDIGHELIAAEQRLFLTVIESGAPESLWVSDGTSAGTTVVAGVDVNDMIRLTAVGNNLFFGLGTETLGTELGMSDGTAAGTGMVKDIYPGELGSGPNYLVDVAGTLVFSAYEPDGGQELWKSDGTEEGTIQLFDLLPGPDSGRPRALFEGSAVAANGKWLFTVSDRTELWTTDATEGGTQRINDHVTRGAQPNQAHIFNNQVLFVAQPCEGTEPYCNYVPMTTDGTASETEFIDFEGSSIGEIAVTNTHLFYWEESESLGVYATDGTLGGAVHVYDGPILRFDDSVATDDYFFFVARESSTNLWRTDGTITGTIPLQETISSISLQLGMLSNEVYFEFENASGAIELWKSDGSVGGTVLLQEIPGETRLFDFTQVGNRLFFVTGDQIWVTDGTAAGTQQAFEFDGVTAAYFGGGVDRTAGFDGRFFFQAITGDEGIELWSSDGTAAGTGLFVDIFPGADHGIPDSLLATDDRLFFVAEDGVHGREPWISDGTSAGTQMIRDIHVGPGSSNASAPIDVDGTVFFGALDNSEDFELWQTDGTENRTAIVRDIFPGLDERIVAPLIAHEGQLYFAADEGLHGYELWTATPRQVFSGDFDGDGVYNCSDVDALTHEIAAGNHNPAFDLDGDGLVNTADRDAWLAEAGAANLPFGNAYLLGDANLDGIVDGLDFIAWNDHKYTADNGWCGGDFTGDGITDGLDFIEWNENKFTSAIPTERVPKAERLPTGDDERRQGQVDYTEGSVVVEQAPSTYVAAAIAERVTRTPLPLDNHTDLRARHADRYFRSLDEYRSEHLG